MKKYIILLFIIPSIAFAGYGWERYVDPKIDMLMRRINFWGKRVEVLEQRVKELEQQHKDNLNTDMFYSYEPISIYRE